MMVAAETGTAAVTAAAAAAAAAGGRQFSSAARVRDVTAMMDSTGLAINTSDISLKVCFHDRASLQTQRQCKLASGLGGDRPTAAFTS